MATTIINTFHDTEYETRKTPKQLSALCDRIGMGTATPADKAFARRVKNELCGSTGCQCGGTLGERPAWNWIEQDA